VQKRFWRGMMVDKIWGNEKKRVFKETKENEYAKI
jgi:hypothetical protein